MKTELKILTGIIVMLLMIIFGVVLAFANNYNVQANNNNNNGYIFIGTGQKQGSTEIGTWKDPTTIPTLKGDKGDTGATGQAGQDGTNGTNGKDGKDVDPTTVNNLQNADITLQNNINSETTSRIIEDNSLITSINNEISNRVSDISSVHNNINNETTARINNVYTLQNNINGESTTRKNADIQLQNNINDVNNRVDNVEHRVNKLYGTQYTVEGNIRILDTKKVTILPYIKHNFTIDNNEVGVRIVFKMGKSYEEKEIDKTNTRLANVEAYLGTPEVKEAITQVKMNKIKVDTDGRSFIIHKEF